jgi:hypothetical protein
MSGGLLPRFARLFAKESLNLHMRQPQRFEAASIRVADRDMDKETWTNGADVRALILLGMVAVALTGCYSSSTVEKQPIIVPSQTPVPPPPQCPPGQATC